MVPSVPVHSVEHVLRPDAALHGAVLVHVNLRALHLVDQAPQSPHQHIAALVVHVNAHNTAVQDVAEENAHETRGSTRQWASIELERGDDVV